MESDGTAAAEVADLCSAVAAEVGEVVLAGAVVAAAAAVGIDCCHGKTRLWSRPRFHPVGPVFRPSVGGQCATGCASGGGPCDRSLECG